MKPTVTPLPDGFGAVVDHDLRTGVAPGLAEAMTDALHQYRVLVFASQHLNHTDLLTTVGLFGTIDTDVDRRYSVAGFPGLTVISNIVDNGQHVGIYDGDNEDEWHADNSFKEQLTSATVLYSVITPASGGETRFADATRAHNDLPSDIRTRIENLHAVHSIQELGVRQAAAAGGHSSAASGTLVDRDEATHPLAPVHPATGLRSLLVGSMVVKHIDGLGDHDSRQLLTQLLAHTTSPQYLYSHRWHQGDLVVWDNRAVLHTASPCDSSRHQRLLYRAAIR